MNKIALAERLEGYAKVFASECPIAVDLVAMGEALRHMDDEKFATIINDDYQADEEVEAVGLGVPMGPGPKYGPGVSRPSQQRPGYGPGGRGPMMALQPPTQEELVKNPQLAKEWAQKVERALQAQDETVDAGQNTDIPKAKNEPVGKSWSKSASAAVLQALVRDVTGMNKSVCCDTNQKLTKEQMPDAEKKAETPASLKPDQTPDESESLDSNMVAKSKKTPVKKEAGSKKGPGNPDGTGPMSGTKECPKSDKDAQDEEKLEEKHEEKEEEALKEIADGLETAQEGLEKVEKAEVAEKAVDEVKDKNDKEAAKKTTEEELAELKKQKAKEEKAKQQEETKRKSRPKSQEPSQQERSAGDTVMAEGFEFDATMQDIDINPEEQKKLASLFQ